MPWPHIDCTACSEGMGSVLHKLAYVNVFNTTESLSAVPRLFTDTWLSVLFNVANIAKTKGKASGLKISIILTT